MLREKKRASEKIPDTTSAAQRILGIDQSSHANENVWTDLLCRFNRSNLTA
ncbi:hypothetical protein PROFUN_04682 [Planoprotostelium fungivorum]|uniref:Uncharacterized protein n=1 Tax=Planoprotostelium fungivorum TaxID=1890364 RepID=A0A2P6NFS9_9EUKA|nr:hypothetical protein PROFUN_04682 [Planoprotostelium fungivorum]